MVWINLATGIVGGESSSLDPWTRWSGSIQWPAIVRVAEYVSTLLDTVLWIDVTTGFMRSDTVFGEVCVWLPGHVTWSNVMSGSMRARICPLGILGTMVLGWQCVTVYRSLSIYFCAVTCRGGCHRGRM